METKQKTSEYDYKVKYHFEYNDKSADWEFNARDEEEARFLANALLRADKVKEAAGIIDDKYTSSGLALRKATEDEIKSGKAKDGWVVVTHQFWHYDKEHVDFEEVLNDYLNNLTLDKKIEFFKNMGV